MKKIVCERCSRKLKIQCNDCVKLENKYIEEELSVVILFEIMILIEVALTMLLVIMR